MNYYVQGFESRQRFNLVFSGTRLKSADVEEALRMFLVEGHEPSFICDFVPIDRSNFNRALKRYNDQLTIIEQVKELDWPGYQAAKRA